MTNVIDAFKQYQRDWTAYGEQYASRFVWVKSKKQEVAAALNIEVAFQKIMAYDQRWWITRRIIRLFTSIEKERALLALRLTTDVFTSLSTTPTIETLKQHQGTFTQLTAIAKGAPRSSWLRKAVTAFTDWAAQCLSRPATESTIAPNPPPPQAPQPPERSLQLRAQPSSPAPTLVLASAQDHSPAIQAFHDKLKNDIKAITRAFKLGERAIVLALRKKDRAAAQAAFHAFKSEVRKAKLYYHPDKASVEKAKDAGLPFETFQQLLIPAFQSLSPFFSEKQTLKSDWEITIEQSFQQDDQLDALANEIDALISGQNDLLLSFETIRKDQTIISEMLKAMDVKLKALALSMQERQETLSHIADEVKNNETRCHQEIATVSETIAQLTQLVMSTCAGSIPSTATPLTQNPNTLFANPHAFTTPMTSSPTPTPSTTLH